MPELSDNDPDKFFSHVQKVNVWADLVRSKILGTDCFEDKLTGYRYLHFLKDFVAFTIISGKNCDILDENL